MINSHNLIGTKLAKYIRIILALIVFNSIINRTIYSWNNEISPLLYFTVQTNLAIGLYWFLGSIIPKIRSSRATIFITTYIAITGIVFTLFLNYGFTENIYIKLGTGKITDTIHYYSMISSIITHYFIPFLAVLDFVLLIDVRNMKFDRKVILYPVVYFIFAVFYAFVTGKYIYPFFDPNYMEGWAYVALICLGILFIIILLSRVLYKLNYIVQNKIDAYYKKILAGVKDEK